MQKSLAVGPENEMGIAKGRVSDGHNAALPAEGGALPQASSNTGSDDPLSAAEREIQAGRYDVALKALQKLAAQASLAEPVRGKAQRLAADCYYFVGLKGSNPFLLAAVEQYKNILQRYHDPTAGNDLTYYRMAQCYDKLNFYYESANALDKLTTFYPSSSFSPEAIFKQGCLQIQIGKYNRAVEKLIDYVNKYPDGPHAKTATYTIGDCYYRLQKIEFASKWYDEGRKRWPDLQHVSLSILQNMGNLYFAAGRFDVALPLFSLYANLYPDEEFGIKSLYMMARVSEAMGQKELALKLYQLYKEKHPQGNDADACALAMANLGVTEPGMKFPNYVMANDDYLQPLQTYDKALSNSPEGEKLAAIMLAKGEALTKYGRLKEGFDLYLGCINQAPQGKNSAACREKLQFNARLLIDGFYEKPDYLAVANVYCQINDKGITLANNFDTRVKIAESLLALGLHDEAAVLYAALQKICNEREKENKITLALARIDIAKNRGAEAEAKLHALMQKGAVKDRSLRNEITLVLADWYYKTGSYDRAHPLYAVALNDGGEYPVAAYRNYGRSLLGSHLPDKAMAVYRDAIKSYERHPARHEAAVMGDIYMGLGDACYEASKYEEGIAAYKQAFPLAVDGNITRWLNYRVGKGYVLLRDLAKAKKSFLQVRENADGEFWPKVTDYALGSQPGLAEDSKK